MEAGSAQMFQNVGAGIVAALFLAALWTLISPMFEGDKIKRRLSGVLDERESMKRTHLNALQKDNAGLRKENKGFVKNIVDQLSLEKVLAASDLKDKMAQAGLRGQRPIYVFYFFRLVAPIFFFFASVIYVLLLSPPSFTTFHKAAVVLAATAFGYYGPSIYLKNKAGKRMASIMPAFPDALDLLLICVESGMSIEMAFNKVSQEVASASIELAEEFSITTAELSYLQSRRQAYENMARRNNHEGIRSVATALVQAERYGTPLGDSLRTMANENRQMRVNAAEKKAAALPAKLTVPMILFFLPVLFIVILTPAGISIKENMGGGQADPGVN